MKTYHLSIYNSMASGEYSLTKAILSDNPPETYSKSPPTVAIHNESLFTRHRQVALGTTEKNTINKSWIRTRDLTESQ